MCQYQLDADVGVDVTVRNLVDHLAQRPSSFPIRRVELVFVDSLDGLAKAARRFRDGGDRLRARFPGELIGGSEAAGWKARIRHRLGDGRQTARFTNLIPAATQAVLRSPRKYAWTGLPTRMHWWASSRSPHSR